MSEFYAIFSIMFDEETSYNKNGPGNVIFGGEVSRFLYTFQLPNSMDDDLEKQNFYQIYKKILDYTKS